MEEESLLTVQEVAEWLRVTPATIYKMVKQGRLEVHHVGKQLRFRPEDVYAFLRGYHEGEGPN